LPTVRPQTAFLTHCTVDVLADLNRRLSIRLPRALRTPNHLQVISIGAVRQLVLDEVDVLVSHGIAQDVFSVAKLLPHRAIVTKPNILPKEAATQIVILTVSGKVFPASLCLSALSGCKWDPVSYAEHPLYAFACLAAEKRQMFAHGVVLHPPCTSTMVHPPCTSTMVHLPCTSMMVHPLCTSTMVHQPCTSMMVHPLCTSTMVHPPYTSMMVHPPYTSTMVHQPCTSMMVHPPYTSMMVHPPYTSMMVHQPCTSTMMHQPCTSTMVHLPCTSMMVHLPCTSMMVHQPCTSTMVYVGVEGAPSELQCYSKRCS
jgi:hypothetical protein